MTRDRGRGGRGGHLLRRDCHPDLVPSGMGASVALSISSRRALVSYSDSRGRGGRPSHPLAAKSSFSAAEMAARTRNSSVIAWKCRVR